MQGRPRRKVPMPRTRTGTMLGQLKSRYGAGRVENLDPQSMDYPLEHPVYTICSTREDML